MLILVYSVHLFLIPVSAAQEPEPHKTPETGITLVSPGGLRVELAAGFDATALKQVLNLLELAWYEEQFRLHQHKQFGTSSERLQ